MEQPPSDAEFHISPAALNKSCMIDPCVFPRIEILDLHKLKPEHFKDMETALAAADELIEKQRSQFTEEVNELHPDIIIGNPLLDQFWYAKHNGTSSMLHICIQRALDHDDKHHVETIPLPQIK